MAALLLLLLPGRAFSREATNALAEYREWIAAHESHFEAHPEQVGRSGTGWKPFHRYKWFTEQRIVRGELPDAEARSSAWKDRMTLVSNRVGTVERPWFSLGPANFAGRMLAVAFHPTDASIAYAGSAGGGLWKSTDGGSSWVPLTDSLPSLAVGGVVVSPLDPDVVVIATGEGTYNIDRIGGTGILRSTNAGQSWKATNVTVSASSGHGFHFVHANPITGTMLAGATDGLYRSTDQGASWVVVKSGGSYFDAVWRPGDASTVYTVRGACNCVGANVKISTDDGATFVAVGGGSPSGTTIGKSKLAVTPADPAVVYAIYTHATAYDLIGVWRSTDGGASWAQRATSPNIPGSQGWYNLSLAADPNDAQTVIAGGVGLYRSVDGGATFSSIGGNVHVDHHAAVYEPGNPDAVWVASDGGLWRSPDDGGTWTDRNQGLVTYQFYDVCVNKRPGSPYYVLGGTQDNGTDLWTGTLSWNQGLGGDGMVCNINEANGTSVFAETQYGVHYRNTNSGVGGWTQVNSGITGSGSWVAPVAQDPARGGSLYTETTDGIFRTTSGGTTGWFQVATHRAVWIDFSRVDGNVAWTTHGSGTYVTTDDGSSWAQAAAFGFPTGTPTKIHAHPGNVDAALVTFSGYGAIAHVALTTDRGGSWTDVSGDLPEQPVNAIAIDPDLPTDWYIGTDVGVYRSENGGVNWIPIGDGTLPNTVISDLEISGPHRKLVVGTHGRGAWELDIPLPSPPPQGGGSAPVSADVVPAGVPSLLLDAPWPNPAHESVMLRFASRHPTPARLVIYDVQGRVVADIAEVAGDGIIRNAPWFPDGRPAGVYFAVLAAGAERISRKVTVTR